MTRAWAPLGVALVVAACGGKDARAPVGTSDDRHLEIVKRKDGPEGPVVGNLVASIGEHTLGPFFARRGSGDAATGLVAWLTVAEGTNRRILVVPVGANGAPRGAEAVAAYVPIDTTMLVVRPLGGSAPGFVVAWASLTDRGKALWTAVIGDDGQPRTRATELTRTNDDVAWIDIVPTDHGAVCLWAEETRTNDANIVAASIDTDGRVRGVATRVASGVIGWHALEVPGGIGLSTVVPSLSDSKLKAETRRQRAGALLFSRLDADGHHVGNPITVANRPVVSGDVEVTRNGSDLLFAWTDRTTEEPAIAMANVDAKNQVTAPKRVIEARGGATLLGLSGGSAGAAVMFEAPIRRSGESRHVHVTRVGPGLVPERKPLTLDVVGSGTPELAATSTGFSVLATTADCERGSVECINAPPVATMFRTDEKAVVVQREPLRFTADPATLGWGMTCDGDTCVALAASPGTPSRVRTATVRPSARDAKAVAKPDAPAKTGPRLADLTAISSGESVVDLASVHVGDSTIVAMLSAPEGKRGNALTLSTRVIDARGVIATPLTISTKALSIGRVAIAAAEKPEDGGAIAWVARENGDPEVHVTRIDSRGKRTNDVQLTTTKGDASNVTLTQAGNGWIVAWVDGRDGNGEVYATKVTPDLKRVAREERITRAPGDASDLVALAHEDAVWLAWSDPRESPKDAIADVYVSAVRMHDAKRVFPEQRLLPTAAHSRTPHLADGPNGIHVAWIEEAPMGAETPSSSGYGAFWTKLDPSGRPDKPKRIPLASDGAATSVALDATAGLRAVVARTANDTIALDAIDLVSGRGAALLTLDGPPSLDVALVLDGNMLTFNDDGPDRADRRARRARIVWTEK